MSIRKKFAGKKSVLISWLISYIAVLLFPLVGNIITYTQARESLSREVTDSNMLRLQTMNNDFSKYFRQNERIATELSFNTRLNDLIKQNTPNSDTSWLAYNIGRDIRSYMLATDEDMGLYIYIPKLDKILTKNVMIDSHSFYNAYYNSGETTYDEWIRNLKGSIEPISRITDSNYINGTGKKIETMRQLSMNGIYEDDSAVLSTLFSSESLFNSSGTVDASADIVMLDKDNEILVQNKEEYPENFFASDSFDDNAGTFYFKLNGKKMAASYVKADYEGIKYVYILPEHIFNQKTNVVLITVIISMVLYILASLLIITISVRRNYRPLRELMALMRKIENTGSTDKNEYGIIREAAEKLLKSNISQERMLTRQKNDLRNAFLNNYICLGAKIDYKKRLEEFDMQYSNAYFYVAIMKIGSFGASFADEQGRDLAGEAVMNIAEEIFEKRSACDVFHGNAGIVCLLNTIGYDEKMIMAQLSEIIDDVGNYLDISVTAALGKGVSDFSELHASYISAENAAEYINMTGGDMISYTEITKDDATGVAESIIKYIDEHYTDDMLNVTAIANEFSLSPTYISRMFMSQKGVKLLDYINNYRISKAKEILVKDPEMSVEKVGESVGFSVNRTFLRVFKKYAEMSPSAYRESESGKIS